MITRRQIRGGFTLIELLVVITIILLISAVALPTVLPALAHRQVSEAARTVQGALVGARDSAIHNNAPAGIRLLPDPAFPIMYTTITLPNGNTQTQIDPTQPLAANRIVPIEAAPQYSEGLVNLVTTAAQLAVIAPPYPCLVIAESVLNNTTTLPNSPTSWFWNVRVGDKIQINQAGPWYTVVGPMAIYPTNPTTLGQNPELFVNIGTPGTTPANQMQVATAVTPEYLFLVNGLDDNQNGWIDEGYDGADNDNDGLVDETTCKLFPAHGEWEIETWAGSVINGPQVDLTYAIQRRPVPSTNAREIALPSNVVIDLTTWGYPDATSTLKLQTPSMERSRVPINLFSGYVDILVYPNGTVVPTTIYSTDASFGMAGAFFHLWLAERSDVAAPTADTAKTTPPYLPIGNISQQLLVSPFTPYAGAQLKGEYRLVTVFAKTGQITTIDDVQFDNPAHPANQITKVYNPSYPFLAAQQGIRGGP